MNHEPQIKAGQVIIITTKHIEGIQTNSLETQHNCGEEQAWDSIICEQLLYSKKFGVQKGLEEDCQEQQQIMFCEPQFQGKGIQTTTIQKKVVSITCPESMPHDL